MGIGCRRDDDEIHVWRAGELRSIGEDVRQAELSRGPLPHWRGRPLAMAVACGPRHVRETGQLHAAGEARSNEADANVA